MEMVTVMPMAGEPARPRMMNRTAREENLLIGRFLAGRAAASPVVPKVRIPIGNQSYCGRNMLAPGPMGSSSSTQITSITLQPIRNTNE